MKENYAYMTIDEFADLVQKNEGKEIGFCEAGNEDNGRFDYNWYCAAVMKIFDDKNLICGYCGSGVDYCVSYNDMTDFDQKTVAQELEGYIKDNLGSWVEYVCVDMDDLK